MTKKRLLEGLFLLLLSVSFICAKPQEMPPTLKPSATTEKVIDVNQTATMSPTISMVDECRTPFGKRGQCIPLQRCEYLFNMLRRKPLLEEHKVFLKHSQCGYRNRTVLVCCTEEQMSVAGVAAIALSAAPINLDKRALLPAPNECGKMLSNRLYGGYKTDVDAFAWTVLLEYSKGGNQTGLHCGGALISNRYVVTAAHCITALPSGWSLRQVRLGEWNTSIERDCNIYDDYKNCTSARINVPIESITLHDGYVSASGMRLHDLALIRLSNNVNFTDFIQPVCLPIGEHILHAFYGQGLDIVGWGAMPQGMFSTVKQKISGSVLSHDDCNQIYAAMNAQLDPTQFCVEGRLINDTCRIDSGGTAMSFDTSNMGLGSFYLAGIHSFGATCGLTPQPVVFTRIYDYLDWILSNIQP